MTNRLISLVLATYGRCTDVGRLLDSLAVQTDSDFEVLIVDQNPDDRLQEHVHRGLAHGMRICHLRMDHPSLSGARNLGIRHAHGMLVGFPDDDCWYEPDTLEKVRTAFSRHADVQGVVGTWQEMADRDGANPTGSLSYSDWLCFRGKGGSSITLFFQHALCAHLEGFDERFGVGKWYGAGEETDFVLRALASGARVDYCADVVVHHALPLASTVSLQEACLAMRARGRGTGAIYAKHDMKAWVILRGIVGQTLRPLLAGRLRQIPAGASAALGSLEGFLAWRSKEQ